MIRLGTILIPAWNEGAVIGRTLGHLQAEEVARFFHVVVIANACTDDTAARARAAMPAAQVIETPTAGKTQALNLGHAQALPGLPVLCLDADLVTGLADLIALTVPLRDGRADAACGTMRVDTAAATAPVRAWYRAWALNPYLAQGKFGGLFALSAAAADRLFPLPPVTADDEYLRRSLAPGEIAFVPACGFTARAPRDLASLIRVRKRVLRGSRALSQPSGHGGARAMLRTALWHPARWADMAVFVAVQTVVRLELGVETAAPRWERDLTTRSQA